MTIASAVQVPANALIAWAYFVSKGLSPAQASGIVGNLIQESGVDPSSVGSGGAGIAGWTPPSQLYNWAAANGRASNTLSAQLDYLWYELNNNESAALAALKTQSTPAGAAISFQNSFERCLGSNTADPNIPGGCNQNARVANANNVYTASTGKSAPTLLGGLGAAGASNANLTSASGTNPECQIGFTTPSVLGIGGGQVCLWSASWTRALFGGTLFVAAGIVGIAGVSLLVGAGIVESISRVPVAGKGISTVRQVAGK